MTYEEVKQARQEAEQRIRERATEYFTRDKSGKGYVCPICGSGSGEKGTGITENPQSRERFTCWTGCFKNADIFDIIGLQFNLTSFNEQFDKACEIFGITPYERNSSNERKNFMKSETKNISGSNTKEDYTEFYNLAEKNLTQTDYLRGISLATLRKFHAGFVQQWKHPKAPANVPPSPRLIIPVWEGGYLARDTRANLTETQKKYSKLRVGTMRLFNESALKQEKSPVFIVEGEIDALSIIDAGGQAVGLCSIANIGKLIEAVKKEPPKVPLIILLDSDERGQGATPKLIEGLNKINFPFYRQSVLPRPYKDANEFLMSDRQKFTEWVTSEMNNANIEQMREDVEQKEQEEQEAFEREAVIYYLNDFLQEVDKNREGRAISTGFENFDNIFGGGLYPGLYTVGANSSIGKTTLILQIADNMAERGQGVLFFSLEMSRNELIAKSLSRLSFLSSSELYKSSKFAKTTRGVLRGDYSTAENDIIGSCVKDYATYGNNIFIVEGVGDVGVEQIRDKTEKYIKYNNTPPVIVIDYLQILSPYDLRMTDKQNTDRNILELKRLSRDLQIPVIGISSFNRESYKSPVSMASFKESGAIEYSSDVLIGLQFEGWDYTIRDTSDKVRQERLSNLSRMNEEKAKAGQSQRIQAKILKNRNGGRGSVYFEFYPMFNYFRASEGKSWE